MYKLRFYFTEGVNKGNLDHEEKFCSPFDMIARYKEVYVKWSSTNPTAWYRASSIDGKWIRLSGF